MLNVRSRGIHCGGREFTSQEIEHLYLDLSRGPNEWSQRLARDTFLKLGSESEFDPVAVWLQNLRAEPLEDDDWRDLGRLLFDIDDDIADQFLPRYLVSAVARVISPGCLVRQTAVLLGPQGVGKTEAGRALFGHDWYGDGLSGELGIDDVTLLQQCLIACSQRLGLLLQPSSRCSLLFSTLLCLIVNAADRGAFALRQPISKAAILLLQDPAHREIAKPLAVGIAQFTKTA